MEDELICSLCGVPLEPRKINLRYLGHQVSSEFPTCPKCGNMYIPEEIVTGKIRALETELEDK